MLNRVSIVLIMFLFAGVTSNCGSTAGRSSQAKYAEASSVSPGSTVSKISKADTSTKIERVLIYNGRIYLEVKEKEHEQVLEKLVNYTKESGGYVSSRTLRSVQMKVPSEKFKESFDFIKTLGDVDYENIYVQDITDRYTDTKIRLENAEKLQERLKGLLNRTTSVEEAVRVESELSRVTESIETLKGRMRLFQNQIAFSEISVELKTPVSPGPVGWIFYGLYKGVKWLFIWD